MKTARAMSSVWILLMVTSAAAAAPASGPAGAGTGDSSAVADTGRAASSVTLPEIRDRAENMPIDQRKEVDKRIGITVERVNKEATAKGQTMIVGRLSAEFGMTPDALLDQKAEHGLSFGELVIAHTLLANSNAGVTLVDLVDLRSGGLSWGAIAYGLKFHMEDFEDAIKAEGRVAMGLSRADGKPAVIGR